MLQKTLYIVDTNVYITAYRSYYAFDLVKSFWKHLVDHSITGKVVSIDRVKKELEDKDDALRDWVCGECNTAFISTDRVDVIDYYQAIMKWARGDHFTAGALSEFARGADGWVVAYAKAGGHTVVTLESYEPDRKNRVKIPNACKQFGVKYVDTFTMLRDLGAKIG